MFQKVERRRVLSFKELEAEMIQHVDSRLACELRGDVELFCIPIFRNGRWTSNLPKCFLKWCLFYVPSTRYPAHGIVFVICR